MRFLPYDSFIINVSAPVSEVVKRLQAEVEPEEWFQSPFRKHKEYQGIVTVSGFSIRRIIQYHDAFLPIINGLFESKAGGTNVHIRMMPRRLTLGFAVCFFGFLGLFVTIGLITNKNGVINLLAALGLGLFGWLLAMTSFWIEQFRTRRGITRAIFGDA